MSFDYDALAAHYGRHRRCNAEVLRELVTGARLTPDSRVLELGAGTGNYTRALRELCGCECTAVEPSARMRDLARQADGDLRIVAGTAEDVPFEAGSFDLVFCVDVVHHLADPGALFREANRLLVDGGMLCVATDSEDIIRARFPLAQYFPETVEADRQRYPSVEQLHELATRAGFTAWREARVETRTALTSATAYEAKAFSVLHLIPEASFQAGLARLQRDLAKGPLVAITRYAMLWTTKNARSSA